MFIVENLDRGNDWNKDVTFNIVLPFSDDLSQYIGHHFSKR